MGAWRVILQVVRWPLKAGAERVAFVCVGAGIKRGRGKQARGGEAGRRVQGVQR